MGLFKSKAQTLDSLNLKNAKVPNFIFFSVKSYKKKKGYFLNLIKKNLKIKLQ